MHLIMFDIDGTLVNSYDFDGECYQGAIFDVLGLKIDSDWGSYQNVTDSGIFSELAESLGLNNDERECAFADVKQQFNVRINEYIACHEILPIAGVFEFLSYLIARSDVKIAFATGSWAEPARMKLKAAGLDFPEVPLASSCDHYRRIKIMRVAERLTNVESYQSKTYFGDGAWDQQASEALGYNFVSVGDRIFSPKSVQDYVDIGAVLNSIDLE